MKLAIFSDTHLGFGKGSERENESFENMQKAIAISINEKTEAIIMVGDLFDESIPNQEVWEKAFQSMKEIKKNKNQLDEIKKENRKGETKIVNTKYFPAISIHGTHEYRGKDYTNALKVLEEAGFIIYLHAEKIKLKKENEEIVIQGMGGIPEKKALDALRVYKPQPEKEKYNILLLHQSFKEYLPFDDEMTATLSLEDLPKEFDLIINGHLHWNNYEEYDETKKENFLLCGSTITTQMKNLESKKEKGVFILDTKTKKMEFKKIEGQRSLYYQKKKYEMGKPEQIQKETKEFIENCLKKEKDKENTTKPMIRVKIVGTLEKGLGNSDVDLEKIKKEYETKAILSISKNLTSEGFRKKIKELKEAQENKKSVSAMGFDILEKKLEETSFNNAFDIKRIFELLENGETDKAIEIIEETKILEETKTNPTTK